MIINVVGQFDHSGTGKFAKSFTNALVGRAGFDHKVRAVNTQDMRGIETFLQRKPTAPQTSIFLWPLVPPDFRRIFDLNGTKILWSVFENDRLPTRWLADYPRFDEIWVPSDWGRSVLIAHDIDPKKIAVIPEGVETSLYRYAPQSHDGIRFLMVGKYEARKSIDEAILAFRHAFPDPTTAVELWLKVDHPLFPTRAPELAQKWAPDPRIKFITGLIPEAEMGAFYNQVDALVFPSKAEGFGLPCLEAIASGLPVIATHYSGHAQFLDAMPGDFISVDYHLADIDDPDVRLFYARDYAGEPYGQWAIPDQASLVAGMRTLYDNHADWRRRAVKAAALVGPAFDWKMIATRALVQLTGQKT
jgi:glycosyltransferase involved in cell wall biosynthesis